MVCQSTQLIAYKKYKLSYSYCYSYLSFITYHSSSQIFTLATSSIPYQLKTVLYYSSCSLIKGATLFKLLINMLNSHSLRSSSFNPLTLPFFNKNQMVFAHLLMLHHFFGTIYLTLFALHLHTYLFEKASKHISLIKHFLHRLSSLY